MSEIKIAVAGTGYVGLSIATLLAQHHQVTAVDVIPEKVEMLNRKQSPIQDDYIEKYLAEKELNLTATLDGASAYKDADFIVIAAPTNYDPVKNYFDTHHLEDVIDLVLSVNPNAVMIIKSTIPVGYCRSLYVKYAAKGVEKLNLLFFPEFLRESKALYDNLYPSRIIAGLPKMIEDERFEEENNAIKKIADLPKLEEAAKTFVSLLQEGALKEDIPVLYMGMKEAEAVKLFANTYLALRVSYFNELDTYAEVKGLDWIFHFAEYIQKNHLSEKFELSFYGPIHDDDRQYFEDSLKLYPFMKYYGVLQPAEIHQTLSQYDVMLLPTHYYTEGLPGSIVDAYISGIPVIATEWKHAHEFIEDGKSGFIIPFENGEGVLIERILKLESDRHLLSEMQKYALEKRNEFAPPVLVSYLN